MGVDAVQSVEERYHTRSIERAKYVIMTDAS